MGETPAALANFFLHEILFILAEMPVPLYYELGRLLAHANRCPLMVVMVGLLVMVGIVCNCMVESVSRTRIKLVDLSSPIWSCSLHISLLQVFFKKVAPILEFGNETDNFFSDLIPAAGILLPPPFQLPCLPATEWKPIDN